MKTLFKVISCIQIITTIICVVLWVMNNMDNTLYSVSAKILAISVILNFIVLLISNNKEKRSS